MELSKTTKNARAYFWVLVAIWIYCLVAFGGIAFVQEGRIARYTPLVVSHGLLVMAWIALAAFQAWAITQGKFANHRLFGRMSAVLVFLMIAVTGWVLFNFDVEFGRRGTTVGDGLTLLAFIVFYGVAIFMARRKAIDWHKRFILMATLSLLAPAHARFLDVIGVSRVATIGLVLFTMIVPLLALDILERRKLHKASVAAIAIALTTFVAQIYFFVKLEGF
ncbi:hypothetical protein [Sphingomicrobium flavum]|uniref:hypothetical protein n=1 Tax=Sphingomicrobium flavum TaxID=1229164 RepID=UPI0021ADD6AD|nr:hypothetical protein [Sphingomicrobium flavum]